MPYFQIMAARKVPRRIPAAISDGKCTKRYSLEKATETANGTAAYPNFLFVFKRLHIFLLQIRDAPMLQKTAVLNDTDLVAHNLDILQKV